MHPAVARRFPEVDPDDWLALCEALEIVRGADRADQAESYLERDRTSWEQGLRRLALGAFLSGPRSGEERPFALPGADRGNPGNPPDPPDPPFDLPAELPPALEPAARALGILARELIAFARGARAPGRRRSRPTRRCCGGRSPRRSSRPRPTRRRRWATPWRAVERGGAGAADAGGELSDRGRAGEGSASTGDAEPPPIARRGDRRLLRPDARVAVPDDLRRRPRRAGLPGPRRPARARSAGRRAVPGDVTPREQDEHMFLETLLAARERIYLSYVARDAVTGERPAPASTIEALLDTVCAGRAAAASPEGAASSLILRARPPLARHEDAAACAVIPAAARERRAAALGASLRRRAAGGVRQLPPLATCAARSGRTPGKRRPRELDWVAPPAEAPRRATRADADADRSAPLPRVPPAGLGARACCRSATKRRDGRRGRGGAAGARAARRNAPATTVPLSSQGASRAAGRAIGRPGRPTRRWPRATIARPRSRGSKGSSPTACSAARCASVTWACCAAGATGSSRPWRRFAAPAPLWLGAAPEHRRDVVIRPARVVPLAQRRDTGRLGGRTELCAVTADESRGR